MNTTQQTSSQDSISFILCPICKTTIPQIVFLPNNKSISVKIQCSCIKNDLQMSLKTFIDSFFIKSNRTYKCSSKEHNATGQSFCIDCSYWLCNECLTLHNDSYHIHLLLPIKVNVKCQLHNKNFSLYCKKCNIDICIDCKTKHKKHSIKQFDTSPLNIEDIKQQIKHLDVIMEKNTQLKENFNNSLLQHKKDGIDNDSKDQITQWNTNIELSFQQNQTNNALLKQFMHHLHQTATVFELYPTYSLIQLITLIKLQDLNITLLDDTLEKKSMSLIDYYSNNYHFFLQQKECLMEKRKRLTQQYDCIFCKSLPFKSRYTVNYWILPLNDKAIRIVFWTTNYLFDLQTLEFTLLISMEKLPNVFENKEIIIHVSSFFNFVITNKESNMQTRSLYLNSHDPTVFIESSDIIKILQLTDGSLAIATYSRIYIENISPWNCKCILEIAILRDMVQLMDGNIATISEKQLIQIWSIQTYQCITRCHYELNCSRSQGNIIQLIDGSLATSSDTDVCLWTMKSFRCYASFQTQDSRIKTLMQLPDGTLLTSSDYTIKLWKI